MAPELAGRNSDGATVVRHGTDDLADAARQLAEARTRLAALAERLADLRRRLEANDSNRHPDGALRSPST